jgi:hypothetical protein
MTYEIVFFDCDEQMWFFHDETWTHAYGPYGSEYAAWKDLQRYAKKYLEI